MSETQQAPGGGVIIANILPTFTPLPQILEDHQKRRQRAEAYAIRIIQSCKASPTMTADLDKKCMDLILSLNTTVDNFEGARKPATQMMDEIKKMLTGEENALKELAKSLQHFRNQFAREQHEAEQERLRQAEVIRQKGIERANVVKFITENIGKRLVQKLVDTNKVLTDSFNTITLDNFAEKEAKLRNLTIRFGMPEILPLLNYFIPAQKFHTKEELEAIDQEERKKYDFQGFIARFHKETGEFIAGLIDRLDSKLNELQEAERQRQEQERLRQEQERLRLEQQKAQQRLQEERNEQRRKELEKQQQEREQKQKELERQQQEAENERLEQERLRLEREQNEAVEQQRQQQELFTEVENQATGRHAEATATALFEEVTAAAPQAAPETRKSFKITVLSFAGYVELFTFWFQKEAAAMWTKDQKKFEAMTFKKLVSFAEKMAGKGEKIDSKFIKYEVDFTAVNRKQTTEED